VRQDAEGYDVMVTQKSMHNFTVKLLIFSVDVVLYFVAAFPSVVFK